MAQPPLRPLMLLLHNDCTGNVPVVSERFAAPPGSPGAIHAHLSAFSPPTGSNHPPLERSLAPTGACGKRSLIASVYSCPSTIVKPSVRPGVFTNAMPQFGPASPTYGMFVNATLPRAVCTPT